MKIAISLGLSSLLLAGCAYHEPVGYSSEGTQVISGRTASNDRALESALRTQMNNYGDLASLSPNVQFYAQNGTVTITGTVPSQREKDMIDAMVRNTGGVAYVNDQLQVGPPPTAVYAPPAPVYPQPAPVVAGQAPAIILGGNGGARIIGTTAPDEGVARALADKLRWAAQPPNALQNVTVTVNGGVVTVQGVIGSEQLHQDIINAVRNTQGVTAVYDQLVVR